MHDWWRAGLDRLNRLPAVEAEADLVTCCSSRRWAREIAAGRPYADRDALVAAVDKASRRLDWADITEALVAHPRIGERARGADREAAWSRQEQSSAEGTDPATRAALAEGNRAYEERFGYVFLIRAAGRSAEEMLAALLVRLGNDDATERRIVADELRQIALLRLDNVLDTKEQAAQK
jgi:2-oxo-4-hydroxy-4-carboxy-5-ureidoimidazoline decarboxylase